MKATIPQPYPPPLPEPVTRAPVQPPVVYVAPTWEYKHVERALGAGAPSSEDELNALGADGWELAAAVPAASRVHFYFKRQRD